MIETREGKLKSIVGFQNAGHGTVFTREDEVPHKSKRAETMISMGSAAEVLRKKQESYVFKQPDTSYSFKCEGLWNQRRNVQWNAKYSKSLEYILFPSLSLVGKEGDLALPATTDKLSIMASSTATFDKFNVECGNGAAVDDDINWEVRITEKQGAVMNRQDTLLHEIEVRGEEILREKMKETFSQRESELADADDRGFDDYLGIPRKNRFGASSKTARLEGITARSVKAQRRDNQSADELYASLRKSRKSAQIFVPRAAKKVDRSAIGNSSYFNQKAHLQSTMGDDNAHLVEGVLYYRMRNELTIVDRTEKNLEIKSTPIHVASSVGKRRQTVLLNKIEARQASVLQTPSVAAHLKSIAASGRSAEARANNEEDEEAELKSSTAFAPPTDVQRVRQAISARNYGYDRELRPHSGYGRLKLTGGELEYESPPRSPTRPSSRSEEFVYSAEKPKRGDDDLADDASKADSDTSPKAKHQHHKHRHKQPNLEKMKRDAQDELLLTSLEKGILPEDYVQRCNRDSSHFQIELAGYGIGDDRGLCLGACIGKLSHLSTLGLSGNRLTKKSVPTILRELPFKYLHHLDLSRNRLHDCAEHLMSFFYKEPALKYLDISCCELTCNDIALIFRPLDQVNSNLQDIDVSGNNIEVKGTMVLANLLEKKYCNIETLSLAWNQVGEEGAALIAGALAVNDSLTSLDMSSCNIGDGGAQKLAYSLMNNTTISQLSLKQNSIKSKACFVFSMILSKHPKISRLDLSTNPLGENGARSLFRTILKGLRAFVVMRECTYPSEDGIFNHSYPALDSPYNLDMADAYQVAVLMELINMAKQDQEFSKLDSIMYRAPGMPESQIQLAFDRSVVTNKSTGLPWTPPTEGNVKVHFSKSSAMPGRDRAIDPASLTTLEVIILHARSDMDRQKWLDCMWTDMYCTTEQAQGMINRFEKNKVIAHGGLSRRDVILCLWSNIIDTENKFDFLCHNIEPQHRRDLVYALGFEKFKFNWVNPTAHWRLDLSIRAQRNVMMSLVSINNIESDFSKTKSGRNDTSQKGNWFNFRNEKFTVNGSKLEEVVFTSEFLNRLPTSGIIEFDYVSTTRPVLGQTENNASAFAKAAVVSPSLEEEFDGEMEESTLDVDSFADDTGSIASGSVSQHRGSFQSTNATSTTSLPVSTALSSFSSPSTRGNVPTEKKLSPFDGTVATEEEFDHFMLQLDLDSSRRLSKSHSIYKLLELQIAVSKFYFTCQRVLIILDSLSEDYSTQARGVVCLFSRILDLYNFDAILRHLHSSAQNEVILRIGPLNCFNILKPAFDYILPLTYLDCRILAYNLLFLMQYESGNTIIKDSMSDIKMKVAFESKSRLLSESRPEVLRFSYQDYCELGEGATPKQREDCINWPIRKDYLKSFLVGTHPIDRNMFKIIQMYKEMDAAGALTRGPIESQYATYLKQHGQKKKRTPVKSSER